MRTTGLVGGAFLVALVACAAAGRTSGYATADEPDAATEVDAAPSAQPPSGDLLGDGGAHDAALVLDAACASSTVKATPQQLPVDIIWIVDNSGSMAPAVAQVNQGLNQFATVVGSKGLDYRVVVLSLRGEVSPAVVNGGTRYPVCIPQPLAGDAHCGNGPRFLQSSIDIKSTQPLEQLLGTLDQTKGYALGDLRGGEPWGTFLRKEATKTIVVVTDDESRFAATDFEHFPGGPNPNNTNVVLPPGLLDPSRGGAWQGFVLSAIYGWGSSTDTAATCTYADGTHPPSAGPTYTQIVTQTAGARAQICDGASAWGPFFDAVAKAVVQNAKIACELALPTPANGTIDPSAVNVTLDGTNGKTALVQVGGVQACGPDQGWYYDDAAQPSKIELCPASCTGAQKVAMEGGAIDVLFGCKTLVK